MKATLRPGNTNDAQSCGLICYNAFTTIANQHNFPPDFPAPEIPIGMISHLLSDNGVYSVVAEIDGRIVGSNFLSEKAVIAGIGPITIDPQVQNA